MPQLSTEQLVLVIAAVIAPALTAGAAWAAVKGSINGIRIKVDHTAAATTEIKSDIKTLLASDAGQNETIGRLEERIESHAGWIRRVERRSEARE